jgi:hypothetical protein
MKLICTIPEYVIYLNLFYSSKPLAFPEGVDAQTPEEVASEKWEAILHQKQLKEEEKELAKQKEKEAKREANRAAGLLRQSLGDKKEKKKR